MLSPGQFYQQIPDLYNKFGGKVVGKVFEIIDFYWEGRGKPNHNRIYPQITYPQTVYRKDVTGLYLKWDNATAIIEIIKSKKLKTISIGTSWTI